MNAWQDCATLADKIRFLQHVLRGYRFPVNDEKHTQEQIKNALTQAGIPFSREHKLADSGTIDFLVDNTIGVEIKIKGAKMAIYRQCKRYCETGLLQHMMLVSLVAMTLPPDLEGTPTSVVYLGTAFLR